MCMLGTRVAFARSAVRVVVPRFVADLVFEAICQRPDLRTWREPHWQQTRSRGAIRQLKAWLQTRQIIRGCTPSQALPWPVVTSVWCGLARLRGVESARIRPGIRDEALTASQSPCVYSAIALVSCQAVY